MATAVNESVEKTQQQKELGVTSPFTGTGLGVFRKRNPDALVACAKKNNLKRSLTAFDLIVLGIGAVIGAGIFALSGTAAAGSATHMGAGPAVMISLVLAAFACSFSALCYAEFAAMIPVAGSAYTYTYATLGEIAAWFIGWMLMLEYAIGNIAVASSWSGYLVNFLKGFSGILPSFLTDPPLWLVNQYSVAVEKYHAAGLDPTQYIPHLGPIPLCFDLPAILIIGLVTGFLYVGIKESTRMAFAMVVIKLVVIIIFIGIGAFYVQPENWTPFAPNGVKGIFVGAYLLFFAYIGFDAVSTAAEETKNPQRDLPIGIIGTLIICTILYIGVGAVLTGMVPMNMIDTHAPIAAAMNFVGQDKIAGLISLGAIAGLTSVLLVLQFGCSRILYAMSRDKLLPGVFSKIHPKYSTPHINTLIIGGVIALLTLFLDLNAAAELCNIGTFTAFLMVCAGVLVLRKVDPDRPRPFKVPFAPLTPILGIVTCLVLIIFGLPTIKTLILFAGWISIGMVFYFVYGFKKVTAEVYPLGVPVKELNPESSRSKEPLK